MNKLGYYRRLFLAFSILFCAAGTTFFNSAEGKDVSKFCQSYKPNGVMFDGKMQCDAIYFDKFKTNTQKACHNAVTDELANGVGKQTWCDYCKMFTRCMRKKSK